MTSQIVYGVLVLKDLGTFTHPYSSIILLTIILNVISVPLYIFYGRMARTVLGQLLMALRVAALLLLI